MTATLQQILAVTALIVRLERICSQGILSEEDEADTRLLLCRAYRQFDLDSIAERPASNVIQIGDRDPAYSKTIEDVAREMGT